VLVLSRSDLEQVLQPRELVDALAGAFRSYAGGAGRVPPRTTVPVTDDGVLLFMPAIGAGEAGPALGTKLVTFYAGNQSRGEATIQATYVLMDRATGRAVALMEGTFLTGLRTGAASALAARYLARPDARRVLCFGAGVQAGFQLRCLTAERPIERVDLVGRDPGRARRFAESWTSRLGLPVEVAGDPERAIAGADVITCATTSTAPLFDGRRLPEGVHVDAVGAFQPTVRELDGETIRRARVFVDHPGAIESAGDLAIPIQQGVIARSHVLGDLAGLVTGTVAGRIDRRDVTIFKSVGFALEDLVAARLAYDGARARGIGKEVAL
jgi:ornithine cyclodeaminase/alanine dehydrogenase-like protein (mu-crystallin family)